MNQGFSIILCVYNGVSRLLSTLEHLAKLTIPNNYEVELLLIDNASSDGTSEFAASIWQKLGIPYPIQTILESRPGKGYAVETGFDSARYSLLVTVDDDNWLDSEYLIKSVELFKAHPDASILQGLSEAVFEAAPPAWFANPYVAKQHVVGGMQEETGYLPSAHFHLWGAGLVIWRKDWVELRRYGFSFLTSKIPGKAAGEDSELGLGLWLLGKRIYYSSDLKFKHFMPAARMHWAKLKQNFEVLGYVNYYFSLYAAAIESAKAGKKLSRLQVRKLLAQQTFRQFRRLTTKQHLAYFLKPQQEYYQLMLTESYFQLHWMNKLSGSAVNDIASIQAWVLPILHARNQLPQPAR